MTAGTNYRRHAGMKKSKRQQQFSPQGFSLASIGSSDTTPSATATQATTPTQPTQNNPVPPTTTPQQSTPTTPQAPAPTPSTPAQNTQASPNNLSLTVPQIGDTTSANTINTVTTTSTSTSSSSLTTTALTTTTSSVLTHAVVTTPIVTSTPLITNTRDVAPVTVSSALAGAGPTSTASPTGGLSTGSIVGIAAGGLVAFGVLVTVGLWAIKRVLRNKENDDDIDGFRNSVHVEDENYDDGYGNNGRPRPPTMIERHFGAAGIGAHGFGYHEGQDMTVPPLPPPVAVNPFSTPLGSPVASAHDVTLEEAMGPRSYVSRTPSLTSGSNTPPHPSTINTSFIPQEEHPDPLAAAHYADLTRGSITPYQAAQYAEISRQLNNAPTPVTPGFEMVQPFPPSSPPPTLPAHRVMSPVNMNYSMPSRNGGNGSQAQLVSIPEGQWAMHEGSADVGYNGHHLGVPAQNGNKRPVSEYDVEDAYGGM